MAKWEETIDFDTVGIERPQEWEPNCPGPTLLTRARWVAKVASRAEGRQLAAAARTTEWPRPVQINLASVRAPTPPAVAGWCRKLIVTDYCRDGVAQRWWYRLPVDVILDRYSARWPEPGESGELVATDSSGEPPMRFLGTCVTCGLLPGLERALARSVWQRAIGRERGLRSAVFGPPPFPECPSLSDADRLAHVMVPA